MEVSFVESTRARAARRIAHFLSWVGWPLAIPGVLPFAWGVEALGRLDHPAWEWRLRGCLLGAIFLFPGLIWLTFRGIGLRSRWDGVGWITVAIGAGLVGLCA